MTTTTNKALATARKNLENLAWKHTHSDYRSKYNNQRNVMVTRAGVATLVPVSELTDSELLNRLPRSVRETLSV